MAYRFLRKDYDALLAKIDELAAALREAGQEKSRWANQGAETWHDNFGYEEEQRQEWTISDRLEFVEMKDDAEIVRGRAIDRVDLGCQVTVRDVETDEEKNSWSAAIKSSTSSMTARSPMPPLSRGRSWAPTVGEEREVEVGDSRTLFRVVSIQ